MTAVLFGLTSTLAIAESSAPGAALQAERYELHVPRGPLSDVLKDIAVQTGMQIGGLSELTIGAAPLGPIDGNYTLDAALLLALSGTGLTYRWMNDHFIAILAAAAAIAPTAAHRAAAGKAPADTCSPTTIELQREKEVPHRNLLARMLCVSAACAAALHAGSACAQQADQSVAVSQLEEVVVTAEKREENLQKTPVAVTAITGETLKALGVTSALDLTQVAPNLTVNQNSNGANVGIRGIVDLDQTPIGDPEVAYNLDGVYLARQRAALSGMYDVQRIEVLRGPQGTLYGRNATAGSINVITNKPDLDQASATGSIGFGNYDQFSSTGSFNMPISSSLAFRAAVDVQQHEGYVNDAPNDRRTDDQDLKEGRVHVLWKPADNFSALFTVDVSHAGGAGAGGNASGGPWGKYLTDVGGSPYQYPVDPGPQYLDQTVGGQTLTLNWSSPWFDVTYVGNHREDNYLQAIDQAIYGPESSFCPSTTSTNCYHPLINSSDDRQISHELRFSKDTDSLKWVLGLYYSSEYNTFIQVYEPNMGSGGLLWRDVANPDIFVGSKAAFGQSTWSLTDRLRLTGGLRYTRDAKQDDGETLIGPAGSISNLICTGCTTTLVNTGSASWSKTTWHAGVDYDLTPSSLLFLSVATGYKSGGFNVGPPPANTVYGPESLTNYEVGWKNQLLNNRLQVNVDAFLTNYKDFQASAGVIINNTTSQLTVNAGTAQIKGLELESDFLLTDYDRINLNATLLDAKFTNFFLAKGDGFSPGAAFVPYSLNGKELPYAPRTTLRLGYQHTFELTNTGSLVARADTGYVSHQWMDYHDFTVIAQDAYWRTGLSLTWVQSKKFSTQLYVHNLENKAVLAGVQADQSAPNRDFNDFGKAAYFMPPRTYGISFNASID